MQCLLQLRDEVRELLLERVIDAVIVDVDAGKVPLPDGIGDRVGMFRAQFGRAQDVVDNVRVQGDDPGHHLIRGRWNRRRRAGEIAGIGRREHKRVQHGDRGFGARVERRASGDGPGDLECRFASLQYGDVRGQRADIAFRAGATGDERDVGQALPLVVRVGVESEAVLVGLLVLQRHREVRSATIVTWRREVEQRARGDESRGQPRYAAPDARPVRV